MAKDPAVLFYTNDFLTGCAGLTMEERGQYITLLCLQHQQGHISEKTCRLTVGSVSVDVLAKFKKDENGLFFNERMEIEIEKRRNYEEIKRLNGLKGGRPKTEKKPIGYPTGKPTANLTENEDVNENINRDKVEFVNPFGENFTAWLGWLDYKREEHREKYRSPKTEQAAADKLYKLSGGNQETAKLIIQQSIENRWKGLFELKNTSNGTKKTGHPTFDDVQAAFNRSVNQRQQAGD